MPNLPGKSPATNIHVSSLPHHLLCMWSQGPKMSGVQGGTSNSPVEVIFFICPFLSFNFSVFPMSPLLYLPRHRYAEKACLDLEDLLQQLVELTGNDPEEEAQRAPGDYQIQNPFPPDDKELSFDDDD